MCIATAVTTFEATICSLLNTTKLLAFSKVSLPSSFVKLVELNLSTCLYINTLPPSSLYLSLKTLAKAVSLADLPYTTKVVLFSKF